MSNHVRYQLVYKDFVERMADEGIEVRGQGSNLWLYHNGAWGLATAPQMEEINRIILERCAEHSVSFADKQRQVLAHVAMSAPPMIIDKLDRKPLIALPDNQTLDPITGDILEHDPEHMTTRRLAIKYDPEATAPEWEAMLDRMVQDKDPKTREQYKLFIQEFFGLALVGSARYTSRPLRKMVLVLGPPGSGKSSLLEVLREFFNPIDLCSDGMGHVGSRFGLANLSRTKAWIADDAIDRSTVLNAGVIKKLITCEPLTADIKLKETVTFRFTGPVILSANNRPRVDDETDAVYQRAVVLDFTYIFSPEDLKMLGRYKKVVPFLKAKREFPGILNWAMKGFDRAVENGALTTVEASDLAKDSWREENDPVHSFVKNYCTYDTSTRNAVIPLSAGISEFATQNYGAGKGHNPKRISAYLSNELPRLMPGVRRTQRRLGGLPEWVFNGLKINDEGAAWIKQAQEKNIIPGKTKVVVNEKML